MKPPYNANAEMAVVSSIMLFKGQAISMCLEAGLRPEMFYLHAHKATFQELLDVYDSSQEIELIGFTDRLRTKGLLAEIGGAKAVTDMELFIHKLHDFAPTIADLPARIELVQAAYVRRQIIAGAELARRGALDPDPNADMGAVLDEIRSRTDSLYSLAKENGYLTPISWEELQKAPDERDSLLEKRALEKGQGALVFGPSGCGKSTLGFQMCVCWSAGIAGVHIAPPRPSRIVILQTEDSLNDLREYREGIFAGGQFSREQIELIQKNLVILPPIPGGSPEYLGKLLDQAAAKFRPDIISLNPLLAFCPHDTRELGAILYQVIDPIIKRRGVGFVGVHHTPKLIYNKPSGLSAYDYQYLAAGDARVANWPRLSLQIEPLALNPELVVCFRITKRWQRIPWVNDFGEPTTERYIKHSADKIWWCDASKDEAEAAREHEQPRKILDVLPEPSEPGILREEIRVRAKNQLGIGKHKADEWLNIVLHDGMAERYEDSTASKRKMALFRRVYA